VTAVAALPVVVVLAALALRSTGVVAAFLGWGVSIVLAVFFFPASAAQIQDAVAVFGPLGIEISLIIVGGVCLALAMERTGRQDVLAEFMIGAAHGRDRAVLLVGVCVTCIAESVTGFGVSIVVSVPLLLALRVRPAAILVISVVGLVTGPWGSLAPGTLVAAQVTGIELTVVGVWTAVYNVVVLVVALPVVAVLGIGGQAARRHAGELVILGVVMTVVLVGANVVPGPPLAGALAGIAGAVALSLLGRWKTGREKPAARFPLRAFAPYLVLMATILVGAVADRAIGGLTGAILGSPVMGLAAGCIVALAGSTTRSREGMGWLVTGTAWPTAFTAIGFLGLGATMTATGMSAAVAESLAGLGPVFAVVVPLLGAIAGYITSTTTGANALFASAIHASGGTVSGIPQTAVVASFNASASYASVVSPSRIALAMAMLARRPEAEGAPDASRATRGVIAVIAVMAVLVGLVNAGVLLTHALAG